MVILFCHFKQPMSHILLPLKWWPYVTMMLAKNLNYLCVSLVQEYQQMEQKDITSNAES